MRASNACTTHAASTRCGGVHVKVSRRHACRSIKRSRAATASVRGWKATRGDVDAPGSTHTMVVYWDLDNIRPPSGCEVRRRRRRRRRAIDLIDSLFDFLVLALPGLPALRPIFNMDRELNGRAIKTSTTEAPPILQFPWVDEFMRLRHLFVLFARAFSPFRKSIGFLIGFVVIETDAKGYRVNCSLFFRRLCGWLA